MFSPVLVRALVCFCSLFSSYAFLLCLAFFFASFLYHSHFVLLFARSVNRCVHFSMPRFSHIVAFILFPFTLKFLVHFGSYIPFLCPLYFRFIFTVFVLSCFFFFFLLFIFGLTLGPACLFKFLVSHVNSRSLLFIGSTPFPCVQFLSVLKCILPAPGNGGL